MFSADGQTTRAWRTDLSHVSCNNVPTVPENWEIPMLLRILTIPSAYVLLPVLLLSCNWRQLVKATMHKKVLQSWPKNVKHQHLLSDKMKSLFHVYKCKKEVFSYDTVILLCKIPSNTHVHHISTRHQSQLQKGLQKMYFRNENRKQGEIIKKSLLAMHRRLLLNSANTIRLLKIANKGKW